MCGWLLWGAGRRQRQARGKKTGVSPSVGSAQIPRLFWDPFLALQPPTQLHPGEE